VTNEHRQDRAHAPDDGRETPLEGDATVDGDEVPRAARVAVAVILALLLIPGVIGFDVWPLTGWRLFSLSRDAEQTQWVIEATDADGDARVVSLEELPLGYRNAEWQMRELSGASDERREAVCQALLGAVLDVEPTTESLTVARDRARLERDGGDWVAEHDLEPVYTCSSGERPGEERAS
jgi:hypothetical protein